MSRRDRDYDDDPPPPSKGGFPLWLVLVLGGLGLGVLVCGGVSTLAFVMYKQNMARQEAMAEREMMMVEREQVEVRRDGMQAKIRRLERWRDLAGDRVSRDEFRSQVVGKTEAEVTDILGKPDATEQNGRWVYNARSLNPEAERPDSRVLVVFRDRRVVDVLFE